MSANNLSQKVIELFAKYEQKANERANSQLNFMSGEVQKLKMLLKQNQDRLSLQKKSVEQLGEKIEIISVRTDSKVSTISKELQNFRKYYDECYKYTVSRLNDIFQRTNSFSAEVQKQLQLYSGYSPLSYIQYANQLILSIVRGLHSKSQELQNYFNSQLFEFEIQLGKLTELAEEAHLINNEIKITNYGNQTLKESLHQNIQLISYKNKIGMEDSTAGQKLVKYFQPKFKEILKRINQYSIEIQVVRLMKINDASENEMQDNNSQVLRQKIHEIQLTLECQKRQRIEESMKMEQIIQKRGKEMLELQQSFRFLKKKQVQMGELISKLKIENLEYCQEIQSLHTKVEQVNLQLKKLKSNKKAESALSEQKLGKKLQQMEVEYEKLLRKYFVQSENLQQLKLEIKKQSERGREKSKSKGFSIGEDMWKSECVLDKIRKRSASKSNQETMEGSTSFISINPRQDRMNLFEENQKLLRQNRQLQKINKQLRQQIGNLITAKANQQKEDEKYQDQIESELERSSLEIEELSKVNLEFFHKNHELEILNEKLAQQLQNWQQRSKDYENTVGKLQKEIQVLVLKNEELIRYAQECEQRIGSTEKQIGYSDKNWCSGKENTGQLKRKFREEKKSNKYSNILLQLQGAIIKTGLPIPICCAVDKNGYIMEHKTGNYLVDRNNIPIQLREAELEAALQSGLILI